MSEFARFLFYIWCLLIVVVLSFAVYDTANGVTHPPKLETCLSVGLSHKANMIRRYGINNVVGDRTPYSVSIQAVDHDLLS